MAATTVTEFKTRSCTRCGATGNDPQMVETVRDMTDDEVLAALAAVGLPVVAFDTARPETGDYLLDLFLTDDEAEQRAAAMAGARAALAAL